MKPILIFISTILATHSAQAIAIKCQQTQLTCKQEDVVCEPVEGCPTNVCRCKTTFEPKPFPGGLSCLDPNWTDIGTGYQSGLTRTCKTVYRCAANYYGSSTNGTSGCTPCPESGEATPGSTSVTGCYKTANTEFSDSTGSGLYTGKCYYEN